MNSLDPEQLKIPAYLRKKGIAIRAKQKLMVTAMDRKKAGLSVKSKRALAPFRKDKKNIEQNYFAKQKPRALKSTDIKSAVRARPKSANYRFLGPSIGEIFQGRLQSSVTTLQRPVSTSPVIEIAEPRNATAIIKIIPIGRIVAYYEKIEVAIIHLEGVLRTGDLIQTQTKNFIFQQAVNSMQINRQDVSNAQRGDDIGLKIAYQPEADSIVYKLV